MSKEHSWWNDTDSSMLTYPVINLSRLHFVQIQIELGTPQLEAGDYSQWPNNLCSCRLRTRKATANPDPEVRSSGIVHNTMLYRSATPDRGIRIRRWGRDPLLESLYFFWKWEDWRRPKMRLPQFLLYSSPPYSTNLQVLFRFPMVCSYM
jgi:hypothetical protein